jgi:hypothetical protein
VSLQIRNNPKYSIFTCLLIYLHYTIHTIKDTLVFIEVGQTKEEDHLVGGGEIPSNMDFRKPGIHSRKVGLEVVEYEKAK